jgi:hypothetical protein
MRVRMRLRLIAVISMMLLLIVPCGGIYASDGVLLPPDSKSGAPNLGLVPSEPAPAPAAVDSPHTDISKESNANDQPSAKSILPSIEPARLPYTPVPAQVAPANGEFAMPTTVVREPDMSTMPPPQPLTIPANLSPEEAKVFAEAANNLKTPYTLSVGFAANSVWGLGDIDEVSNHLGIDKSKVTSLCRMSLGGILLTNKRPYAFETGLAPRASVNYDGTITNTTIHVQALCGTVPLPPNKGIVIQIGDKYAVALGGVTCPPPPYTNALKQLIVLYNGNGAGECKYQ